MSTGKINTQDRADRAAAMLRHPAGKGNRSVPMLRTYRVAYKIDSPAGETKITTILIVDGYSTLSDAAKIISIPQGIDPSRIKIIGSPKMIKAEPQN